MKKPRLRDVDMYAGAFVFVCLVLLIIINVVLRNVFKTGWAWAEELILILFAWASYLGIVCSHRYGRHLKVDFVFKMLPKSVQKMIDLGTDIGVMLLSGYVTYLAIVLCQHAGFKRTLAMRLPANVVNFSLVVAFSLMTMAAMVHGVQKLRGKYVQEDPLAVSPSDEQCDSE